MSSDRLTSSYVLAVMADEEELTEEEKFTVLSFMLHSRAPLVVPFPELGSHSYHFDVFMSFK